LSAGSIKGRIVDWQSLLSHVTRREPIGALMSLVAAELDCCQFFRFAITVDTRGVALEVRAPQDALEIVESMFATPS
jgi:hypothetical protein